MNTMKRLLYLTIFIFAIHISGFTQDDPPATGKLPEKMVEYIQEKLGLTKQEAEKFSPVFINYFRELKKTHKTYKGDRLVLTQKIAELRLRYREQFKPIVGEKRSNEVFRHEREFIQKVKMEQLERLKNRKDGRANKRLKSVL